MSTRRVNVGTPSVSLSGWTTTEVRFNGFADLPSTRNDYVMSLRFSCLGHQWSLILYPGGEEQSREGYVAVALFNMTNKDIKIQYGLSVRDANGKEVVYDKSINEFGALDSEINSSCACCTHNFATRSTIKDLLVLGSLVIEVRMKFPSTDNKPTQFIPKNPINKNVLELFMDEETADVVFEVEGEHQSGANNTPKKSTTTTMFHAHRLILKNNTSALYDMCGASVKGITTVSITDVKPDIFKHMLYYTYGGKLSGEDLKNNAKDIINACDKYGVVSLKLEAEACYVDSTEITIENMMDNLLYADSKNLALLKEDVMDYIVKNKDDIIGKISFDKVPGGIVTDVLSAMSRGEQSGDGDKINYNKMRVATLRKMLDDRGLDVDGSREAMIARLKEHNA